ncbi:hypothetical protein [Eisenibacter elegans]|uniref:hypothetical protein n=1 Tax=Eisenibacter elegans TaxID=997 RepID=UPI0004087A90|nr:hypothetical protein [Eisenibacter elegans]
MSNAQDSPPNWSRQSPWQAPKGYFETFPLRIQKRLKPTSLPKDTPFVTPVGYFEYSLPQKLQQRLSPKPVAQTPQWRMALAVGLCLLVVLMGYQGWQTLTNTSVSLHTALTNTKPASAVKHKDAPTPTEANNPTTTTSRTNIATSIPPSVMPYIADNPAEESEKAVWEEEFWVNNFWNDTPLLDTALDDDALLSAWALTEADVPFEVIMVVEETDWWEERLLASMDEWEFLELLETFPTLANLN